MPNWFSLRRAEPAELDVLDAYAHWADAYAPEAHNPFMQLEEQAVQELLPDTAGRSLLLITHDLEGLEHLDEIVVLDHGRVAERGTHDQLIRAAGVYHRLWQAGRCE